MKLIFRKRAETLVVLELLTPSQYAKLIQSLALDYSLNKRQETLTYVETLRQLLLGHFSSYAELFYCITNFHIDT